LRSQIEQGELSMGDVTDKKALLKMIREFKVLNDKVDTEQDARISALERKMNKLQKDLKTLMQAEKV